jgi:hypothetical protein
MAFSRLRNNDYAGAMDDLGNCDRCKRPLVEIDHYGERLKGCPTPVIAGRPHLANGADLLLMISSHCAH